MSTSVDNRIVSLQFDNKGFEKKIESTLEALEKLDKKLDVAGQTEAFDNIGKEANSAGKEINGLSSGVETAGKSFSKLEIMGITALANITNSVVNLGKRLVSNLISPITSGGLQRALNIEQASFQLEGLGIAMSEADKAAGNYTKVMDAVLGTAYSYDVAAKAASQLAASNIGVKETGNGVKIMTDDMKKSIQAMAGVASMTGGDFDRISQLFVKIAGNGRLMGDDLLSLSSAGLNAAAVLGQQMGKSEAEIREMVTKGKISFQDFSDAMYNAFGAHAKESTKLFTGALEDVKAALARIGADFYGNSNSELTVLESARDVLNALVPVIDVVHAKIKNSLTETSNMIAGLSKKMVKALNFVSTFTTDDKIGFITDYYERFSGVIDRLGSSVALTSKDFKIFEASSINATVMLANYLGKTNKEVEELVSKGQIGFKDLAAAFSKWIDDTNAGSEAIKSLNDALGKVMQSRMPEELHSTFVKIRDAVYEISKITAGGKFLFNRDTMVWMTTATSSFNSALSKLGGNISITSNDLESLSNKGIRAFAMLQKSMNMTDLQLQAALESGSVGLTDLAAAFKLWIEESSAGEKDIRALKSALDDLVKSRLPANVVSMLDSLSSLGNSLKTIFKGLTTIAGNVVSLFINIVTSASPLLTLLLKLSSGFVNIIANLTTFASKIKIWEHLGNIVSSVSTNITYAIEQVASWIDKLLSKGKELGRFFNDFVIGLSEVSIGAGAVVSGGALLGLSNLFKKFMYTFSDLQTFSTFFKGTFEQLGSTFYKFKYTLGQVQIALEAFQQNLNAKTLMYLAAAITAIAISVKVLSTIDPNNLGTVLVSLGACVGVLALIMKIINGMNLKAFATMPRVTTGFIKMAAALYIMAKAVSILGELSWENMAKGVLGVAALAYFMETLAKSLAGQEKIAAGLIGLIFMSVALRILVESVKALGDMDADTMMQGLFAVGSLMLGIIALTKLIDKSKGLMGTAASITVISIALYIMSLAIANLASLDTNAIGQGIFAIGSLIISIIFLTEVINKTEGGAKFMQVAAGMLLIGLSVSIISSAVKKLGELNPESMAQGLLAVISLLISLSVACKFMEGSLAGAAAILIISVSLTILAGVIAALAAMDMNAVLTAIFELALALGVIGGLAAILGLAGTSMLLFASAMLVLGVAAIAGGYGLGLIGVGLIKLATGLTILSGATTSVWSVLGLLTGLTLLLIPFGAASLIASVGVLALGAAMTVLGFGISVAGSGMSMLVLSLTSLSKLGDKLSKLSLQLLALVPGISGVANASLLLLVGAPLLALTAASLVLLTASALIATTALPSCSEALKVFCSSLIDNATAYTNLNNFAMALQNLNTMLASSVTLMKQTANGFLSVGKAISENIAIGIAKNANQINSTINKSLNTAKNTIRSFYSKFKSAGTYLIDGLNAGLESKVSTVANTAAYIGSTALAALKKSLKERSPSKAAFEIGDYGTQGFINGLLNLIGTVSKTGTSIGKTAIDSIRESVYSAANGISDEISPTITPVLDLSNVSSSINSMDSMFDSNRAMQISAMMSTRTSNNNPIDVLTDKINGLIDKLNEIQNGNDSTTVIEVPLSINGREFAKATANYTQAELDKINLHNNRALGIL